MSKMLLREFEKLTPDSGFIVESRDLNGGRLFLKGPMQRCEAPNQNKRIYPQGILRREFENYGKAVKENRATGELDHPECVSSGFYSLSSKGWMPLEEIKLGDEVATISENGEIEFQAVEKKVDEPYCGKMVRIWNKKGTIDQLVTMNHRVMLWDRNGKQYYETALEIHSKNIKGDSLLSHSSMRRAGSWFGTDPDTVTLPGTEIVVDATDWAAFLGIWLAEGYAVGTKGSKDNRKRVFICQKEGTERHAEIRELLERMEIPFEMMHDDRQFYINLGNDFHKYFYLLGASHQKLIPNDVKDWSPRLLTVLLEWMLKGDGKNRFGYKKLNDSEHPIVKEYATVSQRLADDVQEVMVKLGYGATIHTYKPKDRLIKEDRMILAENSRPIHIVYGHASRAVSMDRRFLMTELVDYDGTVHCVKTKNENWLARSPSGQVFWTGNTSTVSLEKVSHIVREMGWEGNTWMGRIEILPTPCGKIAETLIESGVILGISSRGVGSTSKNESGLDIVQDDFALICFDLVQEPSTHGAFMTLGESVSVDKQIMTRADRINRALNALKGNNK